MDDGQEARKESGRGNEFSLKSSLERERERERSDDNALLYTDPMVCVA
jgi:hypothetical protein